MMILWVLCGLTSCHAEAIPSLESSIIYASEKSNPFATRPLVSATQKIVAANANAPGLLLFDKRFSFVFLLLITLIVSSVVSLRSQKPWLSYFFFIVFLVFLEMALEDIYDTEAELIREAELQKDMSNLTLNLEREVVENVSLLNGLTAFIASNPDYTDEQFNAYVSAVFERDHALVNMAAAPDLVVTHVFPLEGNEAVLGLDYKTNEQQRDVALRVRNERKILIAGPVKLIQGGEAFIGRAPVYVYEEVSGEQQFWGIVSTPVLTEQIYQNAGLLNNEYQLRIALRGRDSRGTEGAVFFGDPRIFDSPDVLTSNIEVGSGFWQMGVLPAISQAGISNDLLLLRFTFLLMILMFSAVMYLRYRQALTNIEFEKQLQISSDFLEEIGSVSLVGGFRIDSDLTVTQPTLEAIRIFNLEAKSSYNIDDILNQLGSSHQGIKENLMHIWEDKNTLDTELEWQDSHRKKQWLRLIAAPVIESDEVSEIVVVVQDISQKKRSEYLIDLKENYDSLTHLPNRNYFRDRLTAAIETSKKEKQQLALLILDLDNFSTINENMSQAIGDYLLVQFADRIQNLIGENTVFARLSGDEFGLLISRLDNYATAYNTAEEIIKIMSRPFDLSGDQVFVGISIGIAMYPDDSTNRESLMRNANQAMQNVKSSGKNNWRFFTKAMQSASEKRHSIHNRLIQALEHGAVKPYYQPVFDIETMELIGCEALARWQTESGDFISPAEFIPIAEESDLINRIDYTIMEQALIALEQINQRFNSEYSVSINVSPRLFNANTKAKAGWFRLIESKNANTPLHIEITERLLTGDFAHTHEALNTITSLGATISIDDFGTGFSSLSYLCRFPVHTIKIDQSFVQACCDRKIEQTLVETVIGMAENLDLNVIAEGIETEQQLQILRSFNCRFGQGYLYGRPMPESDFIQFIERKRT